MEIKNQLRITIVYPSDPTGTIPGGIDTCIKGIIRWAPEDFLFSMIGVTTDREKIKPRQWAECEIGKRKFMFYPIFAIDNPERQPKIPAMLQMMVALGHSFPRHEYDLLQFHRIEPMICFPFCKKPKVTFIHQYMKVLRNKNSDIRWKYAPILYYKLEDALIPSFDSVYVVHEKAVEDYHQRYPEVASRINFLPTWMDPEVFYPTENSEKQNLRNNLCHLLDINPHCKILVSVGRLDQQKDPELLINSFSLVDRMSPDVHLVVIGDGVLRDQVEKSIVYHGLSGKVTMTGVLPNEIVADWLRAADLLVLSSAYEGMPRCVVEAMGCGLPVATTDVGEVNKFVTRGINGEISRERTPEDMSQAIVRCLINLNEYRGKPCLDVAANYVPAKVLEPVYNNYRQLILSNIHF